MEDINHPDWVPSIKLGYGKTSDSKYIRFLKNKVLKHTKTKLVQLQSFVAKSTNDDVDNIDVSITDSTHDINGYLFKNDTDGDYTNGSQWNNSIVNVPDDHQYTLHRYSDINDSQRQECSNDKVPLDKVPSDNVDNKLPFGKVPSDNVDNKLPFDNVNDKVPSGCVDDLGDCNLSSSFLNNLTKFQQTSSVSVHVQTDLKTTDLDYLNKYCEDTRKKLTEANKKIKLLNTILNLKQRELKTHK
ncbi:hypothetical protein JTE90_009332 [Oedothorax gibbosus]|uniref:Uncharacterized protein n=1 Tax=Oedothorax gibbosus TaxID=931172 RepID=A0AAV6VS01_9ARAC|nr:hypothetical protein JTE90_009332 [Oedothorax gibbosus]